MRGVFFFEFFSYRDRAVPTLSQLMRLASSLQAKPCRVASSGSSLPAASQVDFSAPARRPGAPARGSSREVLQGSSEAPSALAGARLVAGGFFGPGGSLGLRALSTALDDALGVSGGGASARLALPDADEFFRADFADAGTAGDLDPSSPAAQPLSSPHGGLTAGRASLGGASILDFARRAGQYCRSEGLHQRSAGTLVQYGGAVLAPAAEFLAAFLLLSTLLYFPPPTIVLVSRAQLIRQAPSRLPFRLFQGC